MKKKDETVEPEYLECSCCMELLLARYDQPGPGETNGYINLSFYQFGHGSRVGWRTRLIHIWRIIRTGTPWDDEVIFGPTERQRLINFLQRTIDYEKKRKRPHVSPNKR